MADKKSRDFGTVRVLPSGNVQARYRDPDGKVRAAPATFQTAKDANARLALQQADVVRGKWIPELHPSFVE